MHELLLVATRRVSVAVVIAVFVAVAPVAPVRAQPKPSPAFTREYQAGIDAFRLGQYAEAKIHLGAARDLEPKLPGPHRFLAAVAAAEQDWYACVVAARDAIEANPISSEIIATRKLHDQCREQLGVPAFTGELGDGGAIYVDANVAGATVSIGGLKYGATPLTPRAVAVGEVEVVVQKAGWKEARATAKVLPGIVTDVILELAEDPAAHGLGVPPPVAEVGYLRLTTPPGATVQIDGHDAVLDPRGRYALLPGDHQVDVIAPERYPARRRVHVPRGQEITLAIEPTSRDAMHGRRRRAHAAIATAAGLGVVGVITAVLSARAEDDARDLWTIETTRPTTISLADSGALWPVHTRADVAAKADRGKHLALASNVSYGLAAVAFGIGVYLLARTPDETSIVPIVPGEASEIGNDAWGVSLGGRL
jgi:hypothetical protein